MNAQSFRFISKTLKASKNFSRVNSGKATLTAEAFSSKSSNFVTAGAASSTSNFASTFSTSSSFCTASTSNGGSIINNNTGRSRTTTSSNSNCSAFLEILSIGEDDDDR
ncbi:hypothetical protein DICPUDRAFT_73970 [Dictyostelium purpureum]|uniref:Uncharacterized protein n=1 Tax=Dictyostelium purpureum TaxID=5786 RepID=F0Z6E2_DICPU|nr:uncharacterized protein DICPUDRAFT_73970 [Dictyostelium purpureum]EGC40471.1 hypothetical protein DICPUDRAFT_73970 [Dictyostelium purpureum]|eukprot:XP_003283018.1 hypothetical protein DICPUDRAFT_73970 [Dictyostelium purpureum]